MAKRPAKPAPVRLSWPMHVRLTAPGIPGLARVSRTNAFPRWVIGWRRWGGAVNLAPLHYPTDVPANKPLDVLVSAPTDCEDVWAAVFGAAGCLRQPCVWSPVAVCTAARHDPAAGLYCPALFPTYTLRS